MRFVFDGEAINERPIHLSFPDPRADKNEPPSIIHNGSRHYMVTGTTLRGGYRRYAAKNVLNKQRKAGSNKAFTSETARVLLIGGVKGSGDSVHLPPTQLQEIRQANPLLDVFGMGDPLMFGGTLHMGFMISEQEIDTKTDFGRVTSDPAITLPIIRRSLLSDSVLTPSDISDPETMLEGAAANRRRSQITGAIKTWDRMSRRGGGMLGTRDQKALDDAKAILKRESGQEFATPDEARGFLDVTLAKMKEQGQRDVSEQNIQSVAFIPGGVTFIHKMELHNTTPHGVGLFLWAMHDKSCLNPIIGGLAARGCGGNLTFTYTVKRQEGYEFFDDCTLTIRPNVGLEFSNDSDSKLREYFEEWRGIDIRQFKFDYEFLQEIIGGGNGGSA